LFKLLGKIVAKQAKLGIYFQAYLNNKTKINNKALLFAVNDGVSFGLLFFKLINKLDNKILVIIQGLHDRYKYFKWNKPLICFYKKLLNRANCILALSLYEKKLLIKFFHLNPNKVKVFYFGADVNYWNKNKVKDKTRKEEFILTIGNDMHRDYDLLLNHYRLSVPLKFITRVLTRTQLKKIKNSPVFENYQQISNDKLRKLYHQAKFVIIPLKNTLATSGLSAVLQALSMEKPILLAKTPAIKELFEDYKHVLFYQPSKPASFKQKLDELNNNQKLRNNLAKNGRKIVEEKFNSRKMGKKALKIIKPFLSD